MSFETFFRLISFLAVFCGFAALWASGTFGVVGTGLFVAVMVAAWFLEGSRWQVSERLGTALIVLALPAYFFAWKHQLISFSGNETAIAGVLARLILSLTAIKLLQRKSDRDWIFLYLMSFFEILLAAGLSISATYLVSLLAYLLVMVSAVIAFEMRKTSKVVEQKLRPQEAAQPVAQRRELGAIVTRRLPATAVLLIVSIVALGLPMFFLLPRVGGAGLGGAQSNVSTFSGFSDIVRLGGIGRIQQSNEVVMRVRLEAVRDEQSNLYFRGVALDKFDGQSWSKSNKGSRVLIEKGERGLASVDLPSGRDNLLVQTIYLEPLDTAVLFGLPKVVALQTNLPVVYKDPDGGISSSRISERISYRVLSDRGLPAVDRLRADSQFYPETAREYLQLPESINPRIAQLAASIADGQSTRYDKARAVESYLQSNFGYTLEQRAGGPDPLSNFLFDVREAHCEYFATAMAIMLRTQGIATRVVNGFHQGDYNDTADVYVVRQKNAHSWVEVYFPRENAWVPFDPTPPVGQVAPAQTLGFAGSIRKYIDALETYWIQYFVAYDNQEQRSLMRSVRSGFVEYQARTSNFLGKTQEILGEWWRDIKGDRGSSARLSAVGYGAAYVIGSILGLLLLLWLIRGIVRSEFWRTLTNRFNGKQPPSVVEFYDRMLKILADKGIARQAHQTPLEFAFALNMPEAVTITEKYNRVRFGEKSLSEEEADMIDGWLNNLSAPDSSRHKR